jgi:hypothetical protein
VAAGGRGSQANVQNKQGLNAHTDASVPVRHFLRGCPAPVSIPELRIAALVCARKFRVGWCRGSLSPNAYLGSVPQDHLSGERLHRQVFAFPSEFGYPGVTEGGGDTLGWLRQSRQSDTKITCCQ